MFHHQVFHHQVRGAVRFSRSRRRAGTVNGASNLGSNLRTSWTNVREGTFVRERGSEERKGGLSEEKAALDMARLSPVLE
jgi:hypothetical protein